MTIPLLERGPDRVAQSIGVHLKTVNTKKQSKVEKATELGMQWIRENGVGHIGPAANNQRERCEKFVKAEMLGGFTWLWPILWPVLAPLINDVIQKLIEMWKTE